METKITTKQRKKLIAYLKKFYEYYPSERYTIFHFVKYFKLRLKNNKDAWMGVAGETGCLSEDTKLLNYHSTLGELYKDGFKDLSTKSFKEGKVYNSRSRLIDSGKKELFKIELEDGRKVLASSDHIFFKDEMKEVRVNELKEGDSIYATKKMD